MRVCFFGDSYVAGLGDSAGLGWVGRVVIEALKSGIRLSAYNLGVRREVSTAIAARVPLEFPPRLDPAEDPRVVVSFGVNDTVLEDGRVRCASNETLAALRTIAAAVNPIRMLLVGPPATADDSHNQRLQDLNEALCLEAAVLGIPYVSVFETTLASAVWQHQVQSGDGFHPDAEGYDVIASVAAQPIIDWLTAPQGRMGT